MPLALIAIFTVLWYVIHETTPLKPYPDLPRYMLPIVRIAVALGLPRLDRRGCRLARCPSGAMDVDAGELP